MHLLRFSGRVIPECLEVGIPMPISVHWDASEVGYSIEIHCAIQKSCVEIECMVEGYESSHLADVYRRAFDIARAQINIIGFKTGYGLSVVIDTFVDVDGQRKGINFHDPRLSASVSAFDLSEGFEDVSARVMCEPLLMMAMQELISSITFPHVAPVECARAMDRLKHLIAPAGLADGPAWRRMRELLQISEEYLKFITGHSAGPRHGRPGHTPGGIVSEVTRRSWVIMNRYFEFLKRGSGKLPSEEFPLL